MSQSSSKIITKHKSFDSQFQYNIAALKAENLKLQRQIAKLEAKQVSLFNKITILEENTNERCVHKTPPYECLIKSRDIAQKQLEKLESVRSLRDNKSLKTDAR